LKRIQRSQKASSSQNRPLLKTHSPEEHKISQIDLQKIISENKITKIFSKAEIYRDLNSIQNIFYFAQDILCKVEILSI